MNEFADMRGEDPCDPREAEPETMRPLQFTEDGSIDVAALEKSVTRQGMADWMDCRLRGEDQHYSTDDDSMEVPFAVFAEIWRLARPGSRVRDCIDWACGTLLRRAWRCEQRESTEWLLRLMATIEPPACRSFLAEVVGACNFSQGALDSGLDRHWLEAAAAYRPQPVDMIGPWRDLLGNERYREIAYDALAQDLTLGVWHLPAYYLALPAEQRPDLLEEAIRRLLEMAPSLCLAFLHDYWWKYAETPGLCEGVNAALAELGYPPVSGHVPATPDEPQTDSADTRSKLAGLALTR
ncbi:MAG TPA: hypothetical protein VM389_14520 [Phycisphaerae bacterium]|nr:hypothetical protein [Phycisphaerae bacterium]